MALYVVATPIGSMKDITLRALEVLGSCQIICCEDTRRTGRLLAHHGVKAARLLSYHERNERRRAREVLPVLESGGDVALVSNAGTPVVADPGWHLVRGAIDAGVEVVSIPGPCAVVAALVTSGLPTHRFSFLGWPPKKAGRLRRFLADEKATEGSLVFYEGPGRLVKFLAAAKEVLGDRDASVSRELTKMHEETLRGSLSSLIEVFDGRKPRGECTVVIGGA